MSRRTSRVLGQFPGGRQVAQLLEHYLAETVLLSAVFYLVIFGLLVLTELPAPTPELVFIGLVPFLILLIASGRIEELRFGDLSMKFQQAVQTAISPAVGGQLIEVEHDKPREKSSMTALDEMIEAGAATLAFREGRQYSLVAIRRYLRDNLQQNPDFQYVLFTDQTDRFHGLMAAGDFVAYLWLHEDDASMAALEEGRVPDSPRVLTTRIQEGSTLGEARRKLDALDVDTLVVVDQQDRYVGVLTREEVLASILERVAGENSP